MTRIPPRATPLPHLLIFLSHSVTWMCPTTRRVSRSSWRAFYAPPVCLRIQHNTRSLIRRASAPRRMHACFPLGASMLVLVCFHTFSSRASTPFLSHASTLFRRIHPSISSRAPTLFRRTHPSISSRIHAFSLHPSILFVVCIHPPLIHLVPVSQITYSLPPIHFAPLLSESLFPYYVSHPTSSHLTYYTSYSTILLLDPPF